MDQGNQPITGDQPAQPGMGMPAPVDPAGTPAVPTMPTSPAPADAPVAPATTPEPVEEKPLETPAMPGAPMPVGNPTGDTSAGGTVPPTTI